MDFETAFSGYVGDDSNRREFGQSIAKVIALWLVFSRHQLRNELIAGTGAAGDEWNKLQLSTAFDGEVWDLFLRDLYDLLETDLLAEETKVRHVAEKINDWVDLWWVMFAEDCPDSNLVNALHSGAQGFKNVMFTMGEKDQGLLNRATREGMPVEALLSKKAAQDEQVMARHNFQPLRHLLV
jgi:hypothetical protein